MELKNLDKNWYLIKDRDNALALDAAVLNALGELKSMPDCYTADKVWFNIRTKQFVFITGEQKTSGAV